MRANQNANVAPTISPIEPQTPPQKGPYRKPAATCTT